jgi:hypothetical protein
MRALPLSASTQAILDRIRTYEWTLCVYGMNHSRAVRLVKARTEVRINRAGIPPPFNNVYRRYVLEPVKTSRIRTGELPLGLPQSLIPSPQHLAALGRAPRSAAFRE